MLASRLNQWRTVFDARSAIMLALGFSSGLPYLLVFGTLSARLREAGVSLTEIGLLSWLALAYSLKFIWAPAVDRTDIPVLARLLGRKRAWMSLSQIVIGIGLVGMATVDPGQALWPVILWALLVAFASATQDVVVDGWRIDVAPTERQGTMSALYQLGYRFALIAAGAGALYIADFRDWSTSYLSMAALMGIGLLASLLAPVPPDTPADSTDQSRPASWAAILVEPIVELFRRKGWAMVTILALVSVYRIPDFVAGVMANPFYLDLGFTKSEIASVSKLYGIAVGLTGAFAGGLAVAQFGLRTSLLIGAVSAAASNLMFSWLAYEGARLDFLALSISIDSFAGGFAGTALIAFMSALTGVGYSATQYAVLSSLYALPGKLVGGVSGLAVDTFGYATFFALTASVGLPLAALCLLVNVPHERDEPHA